jgi:probable F420-dependent oxidoreductase
MEFGVQTSNVEWQRLREQAQMAEELGFGILTLPDHIVYEGPEKQADPSHLAYDPIMQAAVAAEATRTLRVGHLVLCNLFRHPVFTAQALVSLDHLSAGRAFLGLGSGWTETEFRMSGIPFPAIGPRLRMLDEALTCIRSLWTQEQTTFDGEFYHLQAARLFPQPLQKPRPPILLGGGGRGLLRIAARHADVVNIISSAGATGYISLAEASQFDDGGFRARVDFVRAEAKKHGRDPQAIRISHVVFQVMLTDSAAATQQTLENVAGMFGATPAGIRHSPHFVIGTPEECVAELKRRVRAWDLSQIIFPLRDEATIQRLAREVLPHV